MAMARAERAPAAAGSSGWDLDRRERDRARPNRRAPPGLEQRPRRLRGVGRHDPRHRGREDAAAGLGRRRTCTRAHSRRRPRRSGLCRTRRFPRCFDVVLDGERPHIVLELVEGPRLSTLIRRQGRLGVEQAIPLVLQLASAIHYIATTGVVHLDVKPKNVMMAPPPRLIDLSVARTIERRESHRPTRSAPIGTWHRNNAAPGSPTRSATPPTCGGSASRCTSRSRGRRPFPDGDRTASGRARFPQLVHEPAPSAPRRARTPRVADPSVHGAAPWRPPDGGRDRARARPVDRGDPAAAHPRPSPGAGVEADSAIVRGASRRTSSTVSRPMARFDVRGREAATGRSDRRCGRRSRSQQASSSWWPVSRWSACRTRTRAVSRSISLDDDAARRDEDAISEVDGTDDDDGDGDGTRGNDGTGGGNNTWKSAWSASHQGDGDGTRGNDGTSGGIDGDGTAGNDGTGGGDNTLRREQLRRRWRRLLRRRQLRRRRRWRGQLRRRWRRRGQQLRRRQHLGRSRQGEGSR